MFTDPKNDFGAVQKCDNLVDLVKSFPTNIYLQTLASIQKRTSPVKFAHLAEKSGKGSISNLSTKSDTLPARDVARLSGALVVALRNRRRASALQAAVGALREDEVLAALRVALLCGLLAVLAHLVLR